MFKPAALTPPTALTPEAAIWNFLFVCEKPLYRPSRGTHKCPLSQTTQHYLDHTVPPLLLVLAHNETYILNDPVIFYDAFPLFLSSLQFASYILQSNKANK